MEKRRELWIASHAPQSVEQCQGNDDARKAVLAWATAWEEGKKQKPLLIWGPPGVGKSALAFALAKQMGWPIIESNASELRDKEALKKVFEASSASAGLFGSKRLLVFDEVDSVLDRGEVPELAGILKVASQPVMLVANNYWEQRIAPLRAECTAVEFKAINATTVRKVLEKIAAAEGLDPKLAAEIAAGCKGDLRSAINDLQAGTSGERERKTDIFKSMAKIFKAKTVGEALKAAEESGEDLDFIKRWLEQNITEEYESPAEVARAFDALSLSDVFSGRIRKRQDYGLLKYVRVLSIAGVSMAKEKPYYKFSRYQFPTMIRSLSASKAKRTLAKEAFTKAGRKLHCSRIEAKATLQIIGSIKGASDYFQFTDEQADAAKNSR